jgi:uncharacterized protein YdcH (DUF465 family)
MRALTILTFIFLGIYTVGLLFVSVLSFLRYPFPTRTKASWGGLIALFLVSVVGLYSSINYGRFVFFAQYASKLSDIRLAILLLAGLYILSLLLSSQSKNPLLQNLMSTRRDLALGRIDIESAREQAKIALLGLRFADVLQEYMSDLLSKIEERNKMFQRLIAKLEELDNFILADEELPDEETEVFKSTMLSAYSTLEELDSLIGLIDELFAPIERRIIFMGSFADIPDEEISEVLDVLKDSSKDTHMYLDEVGDKTVSLHKRIITSLEIMIEARDEKIKEYEQKKLLEVAERIRAYEREVKEMEPKLDGEQTAEEIRRVEEKTREYEELKEHLLEIRAEFEENERKNNDETS